MCSTRIVPPHERTSQAFRKSRHLFIFALSINGTGTLGLDALASRVICQSESGCSKLVFASRDLAQSIPRQSPQRMFGTRRLSAPTSCKWENEQAIPARVLRRRTCDPSGWNVHLISTSTQPANIEATLDTIQERRTVPRLALDAKRQKFQSESLRFCHYLLSENRTVYSRLLDTVVSELRLRLKLVFMDFSSLCRCQD